MTALTSPVATRWIDIEGAGPALVAQPPSGSGPGVLLLQEIFGVNAHIRAVAEQYALDGFVVLAPEVFWRSGTRIELGYEAADRQRGIALAGAMKPDETVADLRAAVAALRGLPELAAGAGLGVGTGPGKVGAIGYCMGGRLAYTAAALAGVDASVAYYGGGIHNQLALAGGISCPMQFHYAGHDDHIPPAAVQSVREAFAGKPAEVFVYPGSMHGFNCWARASYHAPSAALAHGRSLAFLAQHLF